MRMNKCGCKMALAWNVSFIVIMFIRGTLAADQVSPLQDAWIDASEQGGDGQGQDGFPKGRDALLLHTSTLDTCRVTFLSAPDTEDNKDDLEVAVWMQSDICIGCKLVLVANLTKKTESKFQTAGVDTAWATRISVTTLGAPYPSPNNTYCDLYHKFGQDGEYNLTVPTELTNGSRCLLDTVKEPNYANTAVLVSYSTIFFMFFFAGIWFHCIKPPCSKKSVLINGNISQNGFGTDNAPLVIPVVDAQPTKSSTRLRSVDAFRGLAIIHLVLGASGDGHYWFLQHARWYGITAADFMFPWFVFIMGTSIHLSFNILLSKGQSYMSIFKKLVFRSISLFALGVFIQPHNDLLNLRIPGVLQRFGITYFVVASSYLVSCRIQAHRKNDSLGACSLAFRDIIGYLELPIAACCIAVQLALVFLLPVPGCPRGYQGPGGPLVGENGELTNCTGGAAAYIDRMFFTESHMILTSTCHKVYHTVRSSDPEGILGTFTSIALCVFGVQAGKILHLFSTVRGRIIRLVTWGLLLIACSAILCKCHMADGWIPLNKNLWSVSFIALTGGTAFLVQALFHILIDVTHFWNGAPLFYAGMNSILLYMGAEIMTRYLPFSWAPLVGNHAEYIILGVWSACLWLLIAYITYRKKIFLKL